MKYRTTGETAELLQVDRTTVWRWLTQEKRFRKTRRKGFSEQSHLLIAPESIYEVAQQLGMPVDELERLKVELEL